jgi:UDP-N-acetylmuramate--alanine ligase
MKNYHFSGIAGCGMSALAQAAIHCGHHVSGSDRYHDLGIPLPVLDSFWLMQIPLLPQDGSAITPELDGLIVSTAIETSNPEIRRAQALNIPIIHRAELLAELCADKQVIAIAGTAGKSTVTGMLGWIFEQLELDPTVYSGGAIVNWRGHPAIGNFRDGHSDTWIIEVDESDKSFLRFQPQHAIITNISKDHYELDELHRMFSQFETQVQQTCIKGWEQPLAETPGGFIYKGIDFELSVLGRHNKENGHNAVRLCDALGLDLQKVRNALATFKGIERRLEYVGTNNGAKIYDDFAHNPLKIQSAWTTVADFSERVIGYWKPHGFAPLYQMQQELADVFAKVCRPQDQLFILPVYYIGGTTSRKIDAPEFVELLRRQGIPAEYAPDYATLCARIDKLNPHTADTILGMGARDPELPRFAHSLAHPTS